MQKTTTPSTITTESSSVKLPIIIPIKPKTTAKVDDEPDDKVEAAGRRILNIFSRDPELPINKGSFAEEYSTVSLDAVTATESSNRIFSSVKSVVSEPIAKSKLSLANTESENKDAVESLHKNKVPDINRSKEKKRFFDRAALREKLRTVVLNAINEQDSSSIHEKVNILIDAFSNFVF